MLKKNILITLFICFTCNLFSQIKINPSSQLYFSPNNDGVKDTAIISFSYTGSEKFSYEVNIKNNKKEIVWDLASTPVENKESVDIQWDGIDNKEKTYPEGLYTLIITVLDDLNEKVEKKVKLTLDITKPSSKISGEEIILSPNYDGIYDSFPIKQKGSKEALWLGEIIDDKDKVVRSFKWKNTKPKDFKWDGYSEYNRNVPDGIYTYKLSSTDKAGNSSVAQYIKNIKVDASTPKVKIEFDSPYFSPNNDGVKDILNVKAKIEAAQRVVSYECFIVNDDTKEKVVVGSGESAVKNIVVNGVKPDGSILDDGFYSITYTVEYENGYTSLNSSRFNIQRSLDSLKFDLITDVFYKEGDKNYGTFKIACENPDSIIASNWSFIVKDSVGAIINEESGADNLKDEFVYSASNFEDQNYYVFLDVDDNNGNTIQYRNEVKPEFDLIKVSDKYYLDVPLILFEAYESDLGSVEYDLDTLTTIITKYKNYQVAIEAHSFNDGTDPNKLFTLSNDRAISVQETLVSLGVEADRLVLNPLGISDPISDYAEKSLNRSVKFQLLIK